MPMMLDIGLMVLGNISDIQAPVEMMMTSAWIGLPSSIGRSCASVVTVPRLTMPPAFLNRSRPVTTQRCAISRPASGSNSAYLISSTLNWGKRARTSSGVNL